MFDNSADCRPAAQGVCCKDVDWNFGPGFLFEKQESVTSEERIDRYCSGTGTALEARFRGLEVVIYEGGEYPRTVRLLARVPTFDYEDRVYDSWRKLYIARDRAGELYGFCSGGGYQVSKLIDLGRVLAFPQELTAFI